MIERRAILVDVESTPTAVATAIDIYRRLREAIGADALEDDQWLEVSAAVVDALEVGVRVGAAEMAALVTEHGVPVHLVIGDGS